jgi:hypothetical protein
MDQVYVLCEIFDDWLQLSLLCGVDQDKSITTFIDGFNVVYVALGIRAPRPSLDSTASLLSRVKVCSWTLTL